MYKYGIVVIGYNRIDSIQRLMSSLLTASYPEQADLIISIDNSGTDAVENYAKTIEWPYGSKIIKTFPERLALKNHVLHCGNYINEFGYDAIAVLEDDVFVAPGFFEFMVQAVEKYHDDEVVAGVSLYTHLWNINADRPFIPAYKGYDVFYLQYPQSWGQVWMKKQWNAFYTWYENKEYEQLDRNRVPDNVLSWPASSWLKYHVEYCIDKEKFFVYPYQSLSTNFADAGTHYALSTNKMQVPLSTCTEKKYAFPDSLEETALYDSSYESMQLAEGLEIEKKQLAVDLYGMKKRYPDGTKYLLSTRLLNYRVVKSYGLQMRPWELNIVYQVAGNGIYLYDLSQEENAPQQKHTSLLNWNYDVRCEKIMKHHFIDIMFSEVYSKFGRK